MLPLVSRSSRRFLFSSFLSLTLASRLSRPFLVATGTTILPVTNQTTISSRMASSSPSESSCSVASSQFVVGYITIKDSTAAEELAKKLVNANLVACVNILPTIRSIYRWEGKVENDAEALMIVKTSAAKSDDVIQFVKSNHPYSVPEVIFTPIVAGNPDYLKWLGDSVRNISGDSK